MKDYIEECTIQIANYIIENNATVRQTAKEFGISKSMMQRALLGRYVADHGFRNTMLFADDGYSGTNSRR